MTRVRKLVEPVGMRRASLTFGDQSPICLSAMNFSASAFVLLRVSASPREPLRRNLPRMQASHS